MLSPDGQRVEGWVTGASVLRALARQITGSQADTIQPQAAADQEHHDAEAMLQHPPAPLPGYQVIEITVSGDSTAAGRKLGDLRWPSAGSPSPCCATAASARRTARSRWPPATGSACSSRHRRTHTRRTIDGREADSGSSSP